MFEAGLFGGALGMRRTFIVHANGSKLPTDLLGFTCVRYGDAATPAEIRAVNQKLRKAIEDGGRVARIEGLWWQYSLTERTEREPSAVSLLRISRDRFGALEVSGRSWQGNGSLSARYWSEASKEKKDSSGVFYYWKGERPLNPNAPQLEGTGEIVLESADRANGYFTTRADVAPKVNTRTSGIYLRADAEDLADPGRARRSAEGGADRRAAQALEVDRECVRRADAGRSFAGSAPWRSRHRRCSFLLATKKDANPARVAVRNPDYFAARPIQREADAEHTIQVELPYSGAGYGYASDAPLLDLNSIVLERSSSRAGGRASPAKRRSGCR